MRRILGITLLVVALAGCAASNSGSMLSIPPNSPPHTLSCNDGRKPTMSDYATAKVVCRFNWTTQQTNDLTTWVLDPPSLMNGMSTTAALLPVGDGFTIQNSGSALGAFYVRLCSVRTVTYVDVDRFRIIAIGIGATDNFRFKPDLTKLSVQDNVEVVRVESAQCQNLYLLGTPSPHTPYALAYLGNNGLPIGQVLQLRLPIPTPVNTNHF